MPNSKFITVNKSNIYFYHLQYYTNNKKYLNNLNRPRLILSGSEQSNSFSLWIHYDILNINNEPNIEIAHFNSKFDAINYINTHANFFIKLLNNIEDSFINTRNSIKNNINSSLKTII